MPESSPMILGDFQKDSQELDEETFAGRHGEAFLLHHGPVGGLKEPPAGKGTVASEVKGGTGDRLFDPKSDFVVFRIRKRDASSDPLLWAGRADNNDVVIPDASVSAVHAFFKRDGEGNYHLQDMNSTNGSFVNGQQVPSQGDDTQMQLPNGAQVVLGSVRMSFLYAREFRSLVNRLLG